MLQAELPKDFRLSKLESYDGTGDTSIKRYQGTMMLHNFKEAILCRAFNLTLTLDWFFETGKISKFSQLSRLFIQQFDMTKRRNKPLVQLMNVKQDDEESLRTYIRCLNDVMLEITEANLDTAVATLINGTNNSKLTVPSSQSQPRMWDI